MVEWLRANNQPCLLNFSTTQLLNGLAMRLNRFLAAAGIASRRKCDELIATGRVTINGRDLHRFQRSTRPSAIT